MSETIYKLCKLGDHADITKLAGYEFTKYFNSYETPGEVIVIRGLNIKNNRLVLDDVKTIPKETSDQLERSKLSRGDLVFSYVGTIGPICQIEKNNTFHLGPNVCKITTKDTVYSPYLYQIFRSTYITKEIDLSISVGAQPSLSMTKIRTFELPLPKLEEQKKIAEILTSVDKVIELTEIEIEKLKNLKKGMMQDLLTKGIGHTNFKDSPIGKIPESWEVKTIREITSKVGSGKTPTGGSNVYLESGIPFIRSQNVYFDGLRLNDLSYISEEIFNSMSNSSLKDGDLLLNISGASIGRACVLPKGLVPANINQHVCIIRFKTNLELNSRYFKYCLESELGQVQIRTTNSAGNREGLNFEQVRNFKFPIPTENEKKKIVKSLDSIESAISLKTIKLSKLNDIKKGLMQDLLTGKVRVKV